MSKPIRVRSMVTLTADEAIYLREMARLEGLSLATYLRRSAIKAAQLQERRGVRAATGS